MLQIKEGYGQHLPRSDEGSTLSQQRARQVDTLPPTVVILSQLVLGALLGILGLALLRRLPPPRPVRPLSPERS
jgi:hypothetical protein